MIFLVTPENFSIIRRRHVTIIDEGLQYFYLCSALMTIEKRGFVSVSDLLSHGTSFEFGNLRGPVIVTYVAQCLAVDLSVPVFTTWVCRGLGFAEEVFMCFIRLH